VTSSTTKMVRSSNVVVLCRKKWASELLSLQNFTLRSTFVPSFQLLQVLQNKHVGGG